MSDEMTPDECSNLLTHQLARIDIPAAAMFGGEGSMAEEAEQSIVSQATGSILSVVAKFLGDNADLLPPKSAVLAAVDKAIDAALILIGRPILTSLISRPIKLMIAKIVESMYDAILNPATPTTEV